MNQHLLQNELKQLKAQVAALEERLQVYEQETVETSARLEQTHQALNQSDATLRMFKSILESIGDGVAVVDKRGQLIWLNGAAEKLLGMQTGVASLPQSVQEWPEDWLAQQGFYHADQVTPVAINAFPLIHAMQGTEVESTELFVRPAHQPEGVWLDVTARSLRDDQNNVTGAVILFHNITRLKQTETALRQSELRSRDQATRLEQAFNGLQKTQAQLVQTEKMSSLKQLVAGVAHEINNPVSFIYGNISPVQGYIEDLLHLLCLYQKHYPAPAPAIQSLSEALDLPFIERDLPKLLRSLKLGADRIRQIVLSLRNFSRLDEAEMKAADIHEGLDNTLLLLQSRLKAKDSVPAIQVIKQYDPLPPVTCYAGQLNQVFMNILSNAIDALEEVFLSPSHESDSFREFAFAASGPVVQAPPVYAPPLKPLITIQTEPTERHGQPWIVVRIHNNGPSLDAIAEKRLFEPFFTTKPVGRGTGLGLYTAYQIVTERHNGQLTCSSEPGRGVEFCIEIPVQQIHSEW